MRRFVLSVAVLTLCFGAVISTQQPAGADTVIVLSVDLDSTRVTAPKWVSTTFTPDVTGEVQLEATWAGGADVDLDVRRTDTNAWVNSNTGNDGSPKTLTLDLDAGVEYRFAVWAESGTASVELALTTDAPPPPPPVDGELILAQDLDSTRVTADKWTSVVYTPAQTGEVEFVVEWDSSATIAIQIRRLDDLTRIVRDLGSGASPKNVLADLEAGVDYRVAVWSRSGQASVEVTAFTDGPPPPTTTTTTTTSTTTTTTTVAPPNPGDAPNIIIINVDDARVEALEVMPKTMSWFGDGGTNFENAYVSTPSCCPSRATLMSGQYVHNNGQIDQNTPSVDQDDTIQRWLSDAGYFTSHTGKYLHWFPLTETAPHWDRWMYFKGGYNNVVTNFDGDVRVSPTYSTIGTFDAAIEHAEFFEAQDDSKPFYLHIAPVAPHKPFDIEPQYENAPVPPWNPSPSVGEADRSDKPVWVRYLDKTPAEGAADREAQMRLMMTVDDQVDRLMTRLTELGEADNTIAIFTSDNGYFWSEHGRNSKFLPYNEAVEVPFLMRWPGQVAAGATSQDLVSHVDILPTVLASAGVTAGHVVDGRDILDPGFTRTNLLTEYWEDTANGNFVPDWSSLRNESRVYTQYYNAQGDIILREYYDLTTDPWELENLFGDATTQNDPDVTADVAELAAARTCAGAACP